ALACGRVKSREVCDRQRRRQMGMDLLGGRAIETREAGAQNFVTADDLGQRPSQRRDIKAAREAQGRRRVVEGIGRLPLVEEPEPLLRIREWKVAATLASFERRLGRQPRLLFKRLLDAGREGGHGGLLE